MHWQPKHAHAKLRPVVPEDEHLLLEIYASTRAEEISVVPWTNEQRQAFIEMQFKAQQDHYKQKYPAADHDIITVNEMPVGRLYVAQLEDQIRIVDITLLPQYRRDGVGTYLITQLIHEATSTQRPLRIYVETFNPSLNLFHRLGFTRTAQNGMHFLLEWMPPAKLSD